MYLLLLMNHIYFCESKKSDTFWFQQKRSNFISKLSGKIFKWIQHSTLELMPFFHFVCQKVDSCISEDLDNRIRVCQKLSFCKFFSIINLEKIRQIGLIVQRILITLFIRACINHVSSWQCALCCHSFSNFKFKVWLLGLFPTLFQTALKFCTTEWLLLFFCLGANLC